MQSFQALSQAEPEPWKPPSPGTLCIHVERSDGSQRAGLLFKGSLVEQSPPHGESDGHSHVQSPCLSLRDGTKDMSTHLESESIIQKMQGFCAALRV